MMSDLISRKAAIEAMRCINDSICEQQAVDAICDLPTAEVTLCHLDSPCEYQNADIAIPSAQQWIPVSEGLPEYEEEVIADFRNEQIGRDRIGVSYCYVQKEGFFSDVPFEYKVVAWMPLPKPWRGEEDDSM